MIGVARGFFFFWVVGRAAIELIFLIALVVQMLRSVGGYSYRWGFEEIILWHSGSTYSRSVFSLPSSSITVCTLCLVHVLLMRSDMAGE